MNRSDTVERPTDGHWSDELDVVGAELAAMDRRVRRLARERPLAVVFVALAAGFALGRLMRG